MLRRTDGLISLILCTAVIIVSCAPSGGKRLVNKKSGIQPLDVQLRSVSGSILSKLSSDPGASLAVFDFTISKFESARGEFFAGRLNRALSAAAKAESINVRVISRAELLNRIEKQDISMYDINQKARFISVVKACDCDYAVFGNFEEKQFTYLADVTVHSWKGEEILSSQIEVYKDDFASVSVNEFSRSMISLARRIVKGYRGFDRHRVAVYPFKENGRITELGTQIARELPNHLVNYIRKTGRESTFDILTRTQLDQIVREQRITMSELFSRDNTAFGKLLKATAIISGNIARREGGLFVTAQMVDRSSGKLIGNAEVRFREESVALKQKRDTVSDTALRGERDPATGLPREIMTEPDRAVMVLVPKGLFKGVKVLKKKREPFEKNITTFYIDKYEVTNEQYCRYLNAGGALRGPDGNIRIELGRKGSKIYLNRGTFRVRDGFEKYPVVNVTYYGASAYAEWAGKRLPDLAEWEKAAGWDPVKRVFRTYPWGNRWDRTRCNHGRGSAEDGSDGYKGPAPVMKFEKGKSFYNVFNMSGNVWEWCGDIERDIQIVDSLGVKVQKVIEKGIVAGGSFRKGGDNLKTTSALLLVPGIVNFSIGFRCVKDPE